MKTPAIPSRRELLSTLRPKAQRYQESLAALPDITELQGRIAQLVLFPLKGLGGLPVRQALVRHNGLWTTDWRLGDRMAMLVTEESGTVDGKDRYDFVRLSQREEPSLARAVPDYSRGTLTYRTIDNSYDPLHLSPRMLKPRPGDEVCVSSGGEIVNGVLENGPVTQWIRNFLGKNAVDPQYDVGKVQVVLPSLEFNRSTEVMHDRGQGTSTLYTDGGQVLLASRSTLDWMNDDLREHGYNPVEMDAFRPNVVVEGLPPNIEDIIDELSIEGAERAIRLLFGELSVRCSVTQVEQESGKRRQDKQPLAWLAQHRPPRPGTNKATFAVNTVFSANEVGQIISVADPVRALGEK